MRETNFRSVPFNRASVSITTSLYDRRALDCTSDRPLIYSLNHLTYLASSSARVRDTLSTDGGIERLVSILKQCHYNDINSSSTTSSTTSSTHQLSEHEFVTKETLAAWKWSLAFQCLVFVGTRGTEDIRCRVAFCGIIPVIATVLDNYLQLMARFKCSKDFTSVHQSLHYNQQLTANAGSDDVRNRTIALRNDTVANTRTSGAASFVSVTPSLISVATSIASTVDSYPTATTNRENPPTMSDSFTSASSSMILDDPRPSNNSPATAPPQDADSLAAATPTSHLRLDTPNPPQDQARAVLPTEISIEAGPDDSLENWDTAIRPETVQAPAPATTTEQPQPRMPNPAIQASTAANTNSPPRTFMNGKLMPRDEDVVWCLEVLAFLSKYAYLRDQLQQTHLVPNISTRNPNDPLLNCNNECNDSREPSADLMDIDEDPCSGSFSCHEDHALDPDHWDYENYDFEAVQDIDDEFKGAIQNIFPLVEQFTTRQFSEEMKYWAGAIMRNSCRKDESKGGVRQCANFECGRWESFPRQFAKCRRCKRTKYCSKNCQLKAWNYHRHWCMPTSQSGSRSVTSASSTTSQPQPPVVPSQHARQQQPQQQQQSTSPAVSPGRQPS